jgi:hypothetical protein
MTPKNSKPKPESTDSWWEAGALDREIDQYFYWELCKATEDRSLDRLSEMLERPSKPAPKPVPRRRK